MFTALGQLTDPIPIKIVAKDNPYYPISYTSDCRVVAKTLKGYEFYSNGLWYLGNAYFEG